MIFTEINGNVVLKVKNFDISQTLSCGQCFRFFVRPACGEEAPGEVWQGTAPFGPLKITQSGEEVTFHGISGDFFEKNAIPYFDLCPDTEYAEVIERLSADPVLAAAAAYAGGIRIMRQDPWEALCSFIISQNNNIPRIQGIIKRLCEFFGERAEYRSQTGETVYYTRFPTPQRLASLSAEELAPVRAGFRDRYILDAAQRVSRLDTDLCAVADMTADAARAELMKIKGVGRKVADCVLLYGFHKTEVCPVDVWIKRAFELYFNSDGFPDCARGYGGIAQQYMFHYIRSGEVAAGRI